MQTAGIGPSSAAPPGASPARRALWRWLVPGVCLVTGLLFATSQQASRGTNLRAGDTANLAGVVHSAEGQVAAARDNATRLQQELDAATDRAAAGNAAVAAAESAVHALDAAAGRTAARGPGLSVVLDDASTVPSGQVDLNQLVVHQSDLQAVANALWAGGAEAMSIAGQRIVATSAVRCVGNTLLLNGRVFSPPFRVVAIGPAAGMTSALDRSPGVALFKQAAGYYGLGYTVATEDAVTVPASDLPVSLTHARGAR